MNKKRIAQYCCAALVAAGIGLNIQNATTNYGISENRLALMAVGESNSVSGTWIDSVISWIISVIQDTSTPTPEPEPEPKSLKCELEEQMTPIEGSVTVGSDSLIGCVTYTKRWTCVSSENGDLTPSECQPKCLFKNSN